MSYDAEQFNNVVERLQNARVISLEIILDEIAELLGEEATRDTLLIKKICHRAGINLVLFRQR